MKPLLYSFRRCPYAIRARLALAACQIQVHIIEVSLADKPPQLLALSPKGEVPVLVLEQQIIEQSLEIMQWAFHQKPHPFFIQNPFIDALIQQNDHEFKTHLDHYKYFDRFPEFNQQTYRARAFPFLEKLEQCLQQHSFLYGKQQTWLDLAIFPFIRQFAGVDPQWFEQSQFKQLNHWLQWHLASDLFQQVMVKRNSNDLTSIKPQ